MVKGPTPKPSLHTSRPSFDTMKDFIQAVIVEAPQDHRTAKKNVSTFRHGFKIISRLSKIPEGFNL